MKKTNALDSLAALAHETRLDIYRLLVEAGPEGLSAGAIGAKLVLAGPTLSFHLNHLRHAGLIDYQRDGRSLIYAADFARMNGLVAYLTENCCQGADCGQPVCVPASPARGKGEARHEAASRSRRG